MGLLSLLLWTPAFGGLLLAVMPIRNIYAIRLVANLSSVFALLLSCVVAFQFDSQNAKAQFSEYFPLNPKLGSAYVLSLDGLAMPMLLLTTLLASIAMLASMTQTNQPKSYHICLLFLEFGMLGVFLAQDWVLFYFFWEVTLIAIFFLIGDQGGKRRQPASLRFLLYMIGGSVFMLLSLLAISQHSLEHAGSLTASLHEVVKDMALSEQVFVFSGFLVGFGVSLPIFPLHGWLPLAHAETPSPVNILLSGVFLNMSAYGLLRVVMIFPEAAQLFQPVLVVLAIVGMLYGALLAWRQSNLKAMLAYASISHMGMVLLGIASLNEAGVNGAILQMMAHGLVIGALFLLVGQLYQRSQIYDILDYGSLTKTMPRFAALMMLALFAAIGLPGSLAFIAQLSVLLGCFQQWSGLWLLFGLSSLITAAYAIRTISFLFLSPTKPVMQKFNDLQAYEVTAAGILIIVIIYTGFAPSPLMQLSALTVKQYGKFFQQPLIRE